MCVQSLDQEDPLEEGMATLQDCLENPVDRGTWWAIVHGVKKSLLQLKQLNRHTQVIITVTLGDTQDACEVHCTYKLSAPNPSPV